MKMSSWTLSFPSKPRMALESGGCKREPEGAGCGSRSYRRREDGWVRSWRGRKREAESGLRSVGGYHLPCLPLPLQGPGQKQ